MSINVLTPLFTCLQSDWEEANTPIITLIDNFKVLKTLKKEKKKALLKIINFTENLLG